MTSRIELSFNRAMDNLYLDDAGDLVERAVLDMASNDLVRAEVPEIEGFIRRFHEARESDDRSGLDVVLHSLYMALHSWGGDYSAEEHRRLHKRRGHTCLPGGIIPVVAARHLVDPDTVVADLGAGNGLQGLLLQRLQPHRLTVQVELSSGMIRAGRVLQEALGIEEDRIRWFNGDIVDAPLQGVDLFYLYRPACPSGGGRNLYRTLAHRLSEIDGPVSILSVADCLGPFLDDRFTTAFDNGHVKLFTR